MKLHPIWTPLSKERWVGLTGVQVGGFIPWNIYVRATLFNKNGVLSLKVGWERDSSQSM